MRNLPYIEKRPYTARPQILPGVKGMDQTTTHPDGDPIPPGIPELLQTSYRKHGWPALQVHNKELCLKEVESVLMANFRSIVGIVASMPTAGNICVCATER